MTQISSITTLLFDWDGTIVDSALLGLAAYEKAFAELDMVFSQEVYEASYSPNWCAVYQALGLPEDQWERADRLWRFHYDSQTPELIEGAAATLAELRARGYQLGVVTSGNNDRVQREVKQLGLAEMFETIIGHEHVKHRKPHPEGLEIALARLGSVAAETAYVGDAPEDIQMGKQANIMTVGVRSNYPTSARVRDEAPDICLESIVELAAHFPGISKWE